MEKLVLKSTDGLNLSCLTSFVEHPKACVQIIHGMVEHKERYIPFIEILNQSGYSVIISDNRGHGESINDVYPLGHIGNPEQMVEDQYEVTKYIKAIYPNQDLYLFAHSMGSLIARNYLMKHDDEIKKLILCGTVCYNVGVGFAVALSKFICKMYGKYHYSKLLYAFSNQMSFKDDVSWISESKSNIEQYKKDPLCSFKFDAYANLSLFQMDKNLKQYKKYEGINPDLRILSISGACDRTTGGTKGLKKTIKYLNKIGYKNATFLEYPIYKHEILNEEDNAHVFEDILKFYEG